MFYIVYTEDPTYNAQLKMEAISVAFKLNHRRRNKQFSSTYCQNKHKIVTSKQTDAPLAAVSSTETLYIVGHGTRKNTTLSDLNPEELFEHLVLSGLNVFKKNLNIFLISCHTGHKSTPLNPSYAESLYNLILKRLPELERHHREKEQSLPTIKAPKHIIGFRDIDGQAVGIKKADYQHYDIKRNSQSPLFAAWLEQNTHLLSVEDFQTIKHNTY